MCSCFRIPLVFSIFLVISCGPETKDFNNLKEIYYAGEQTINQEVWIEEDEKLIIEAGARLIFGPQGSFQIKGEFEARGTTEKPISLAGNDEVAAHTIIYAHNNNAIFFILEHALITNGLIISEAENNQFYEVHFENDKTLTSNEACIRIWNGAFSFENGSIKSNNTGEGLLIHGAEMPRVINSRFERIPDAVEFLDSNNGIISDCIFINMSDDAIDNNNCRNTQIINNEFYGVGDRALEIGSDGFGASSDIAIDNNLFVHCEKGIAIKESSSAFINQATFYHTRLNIELLNEEEAAFESSLNIENSVMSGDHAWVKEDANTTMIYSNLMSDKIINGMNQVFLTDILFTNPDSLDFSIISTDFPDGQNAKSMGYQLN